MVTNYNEYWVGEASRLIQQPGLPLPTTPEPVSARQISWHFHQSKKKRRGKTHFSAFRDLVVKPVLFEYQVKVWKGRVGSI